jgi:NAD(P)-dependent dehydrogenase (short-subunit alcohol dehydrogenase family)
VTIQKGRVVVTGGSTDIGQATALHLRTLGFSVLVGVRREEDAERMRDRGLTPLHIDVTRPEEVVAAGAEVGDEPLAGLVNNAGITRCGPLEFVTIEELREQFEVNVIGQVAVTQAFIGALCVGHGRIVNVGSMAGRVATPITGPYAASKFALEAITDTLQRELVLAISM